MTNRQFFKTVRQLRDQNRSAEAESLIQDALRHQKFDAQSFDKAGRLLLETVQTVETGGEVLHVLLLAQFTTSWLRNSLAAAGCERELRLNVIDGEYDNVLQELGRRQSDADPPDVVVLAPWSRQLLARDNRTARQRIDDEVSFWRQAWKLVGQHPGTRIVQLGYDWIHPGPLGYHLSSREGGDLHLVREMNDRLVSLLPAGSWFVNLSDISAEIGKRHFYDPRRYFWTKQPFSEAGTMHLAQHLAAAVHSLRNGPKKVLVLDLDDTLWGGVVGEAGPHDIELEGTPAGEAHLSLQRYAHDLSRRGVLLAICSKNNPDDAREPFTCNRSMFLSLSDIAVFEAGWDPKSEAIRRIAAKLRLGLDSFVFVDDNPAEREQVRSALPMVEVVELPSDPAGYVSAIQDGLWFESPALTDADRQRTRQYAAEQQRETSEQTFQTVDDYLKSLKMTAVVQPVKERDLQRVEQLVGKTNQFNLTTRRHTRGDIESVINTPGSIALKLHMSDRFGDYGLVSVLLADEAEPVLDISGCTRSLSLRSSELSEDRDPAGERDSDKILVIDTWLMSCRVIGRTAEHFFFQRFMRDAQAAGYSHIEGHYFPTSKNMMVADLYPRLGFRHVATDDSGVARYQLTIGQHDSSETFVRSAA